MSWISEESQKELDKQKEKQQHLTDKLRKSTMTFNITDDDMKRLDDMAKHKGMSKTAILRQSLRLYQSVIERQERGERVFVDSLIIVT